MENKSTDEIFKEMYDLDVKSGKFTGSFEEYTAEIDKSTQEWLHETGQDEPSDKELDEMYAEHLKDEAQRNSSLNNNIDFSCSNIPDNTEQIRAELNDKLGVDPDNLETDLQNKQFQIEQMKQTVQQTSNTKSQAHEQQKQELKSQVRNGMVENLFDSLGLQKGKDGGEYE